jgi:hypothetical protein
MITDLSDGRLDEIKSFSNTHGLTDRLNKDFAILGNYSANDCEINLYNDFAPLSLYFEITRNGQFVLNGGFIFHGKHNKFGISVTPAFFRCRERYSLTVVPSILDLVPNVIPIKKGASNSLWRCGRDSNPRPTA